MTGREFLKQIPRLDKAINAKLEEIEALRSLAEKMTAEAKLIKSYSKKSYQVDRTSELVARIADLNAEINTEVDRLIDMKADAIKLIDSLQNPDYRVLLHLRYINNYTFEMIAVEMNYCYKWTRILHGRALREFDKIYETIKCSQVIA